MLQTIRFTTSWSPKQSLGELEDRLVCTASVLNPALYCIQYCIHPPACLLHLYCQVVEAYRSCLPWYEDFVQRRALARVRKMREDRGKLPMAAYEHAIVEAVRQHPAVVIAGDTGALTITVQD